jgi:site-specific DNA-methyltransferase (adenine-specific)
MLSLAKIGQHGTSSTYCFVPLQDFTHPWTDADLFKKYDLSPDEVKYVESMIKPMTDERDEQMEMDF